VSDQRSIQARTALVIATIATLLSIAAVQLGRATPVGSEGDTKLDAEFGPGTCSPAVAQPSQTVTCVFALLTGDGATPVEASTNGITGNSVPCRFSRQSLICRGLTPPAISGSAGVDLIIGHRVKPTMARFEVDASHRDFTVLIPGGYEPVGFTDLGISIQVSNNLSADKTSHDDRIWAMVSRHDGPTAQRSPTLLTPGSTTLLTIHEPGRYRLRACVGTGPDDCLVQPGHWSFQIIDSTLQELIPEHNQRLADRVNLIFIGSGFASTPEMTRQAALLLTLEGPILSSVTTGEPSDLNYGPFAIEPLGSSQHRFNYWYLDAEVIDPRSLFINSQTGFGVPHPVITTLHLLQPGQWWPSEASLASFSGDEQAPQRDGISFGSVYLAIPDGESAGEATTLAHEFGHALFALRDEYLSDGPVSTSGFPNCAPDSRTADLWWGELDGVVDPFVHDYLAALNSAGLRLPEDLVESVRVTRSHGLCGGDFDSGAIRPSADSLMNTQVPVFGSVNRARAQAILDLWPTDEVPS
jgi:hypothetical protein